MEAKELRQYDIEVYKLPDGQHMYEMAVNDSFFALFNYGLIEKGKAKVHIVMEKSPTMMTLDFQVAGQIELICDRTLDSFEYPLALHEQLYVKYGEEEEPLEDDLMIITKNTQKINVAQFIYEIIGISIPMKKIHPRFLDEEDFEDDDDESEGKLVYSSLEHTEEEEHDETNDDDIDPRWNILKNLRDN